MKNEKPPKLNFSFNLKDCDFQIDSLQNKMLEFYLRADRRFRQAFYQNFTNDFLQFIKDKAKLNEPYHLSIIGNIRGGKSYSALTLGCFHMACYGKRFTSEYICANAYVFMEKLKSMPEDKLRNSIFVIDEEKQGVFGHGSMARKTALLDSQNIIAINNISTIMINPVSWQNKDAFYGLRAFGRCFKTKSVRFMLYNLQEGKGAERPMGCVYLPIFTALLPKDEAEKLEKEYLQQKNEWVMQEMRGENNPLTEIKKDTAKALLKDKKFLELKTKRMRLVYLSQKMGSSWTKGECEELESLTQLMKDGAFEE